MIRRVRSFSRALARTRLKRHEILWDHRSNDRAPDLCPIGRQWCQRGWRRCKFYVGLSFKIKCDGRHGPGMVAVMCHYGCAPVFSGIKTEERDGELHVEFDIGWRKR